MSVTGLVFDVKKYAIHDGPGIRTTVFFKGCPLRCAWCHNPEGISSEPEHALNSSDRRISFGARQTVESIMREIEKDMTFYDESGGGATFSGGEPMMQFDFLISLLESCREAGIHTALDTSGHAPRKDFGRVRGLVDLFLYDIKLIDRRTHMMHTGVSNELILDNLRTLDAAGESIVVRIPLVPGITDTEDNLAGIASFLSRLERIRNVSLLPYNKIGEDKISRYNWKNRIGSLETQSADELRSRGELFAERGFRVSFGG